MPRSRSASRVASVTTLPHLADTAQVIQEMWLPRTVQPWMVYCVDGSMRALMFKEGGRYHVVAGFRIAWDERKREYVVTRRNRSTYRTTLKEHAYWCARHDGRRPTHHG